MRMSKVGSQKALKFETKIEAEMASSHVRISERRHANKNNSVAPKTQQGNHPNIPPQLYAAQYIPTPPQKKCVQ